MCVCVCVNGSHSAPQCVAYRRSARQVNKNKTKDIQGRAMASVSELVGRLSSAYILLDWLDWLLLAVARVDFGRADEI